MPHCPADGKCLAQDNQNVTTLATMSQVEGKWLILKGLNCGQAGWPAGFDYFPCQRDEFVMDAGSKWVDHVAYVEREERREKRREENGKERCAVLLAWLCCVARRKRGEEKGDAPAHSQKSLQDTLRFLTHLLVVLRSPSPPSVFFVPFFVVFFLPSYCGGNDNNCTTPIVNTVANVSVTSPGHWNFDTVLVHFSSSSGPPHTPCDMLYLVPHAHWMPIWCLQSMSWPIRIVRVMTHLHSDPPLTPQTEEWHVPSWPDQGDWMLCIYSGSTPRPL